MLALKKKNKHSAKPSTLNLDEEKLFCPTPASVGSGQIYFTPIDKEKKFVFDFDEEWELHNLDEEMGKISVQLMKS